MHDLDPPSPRERVPRAAERRRLLHVLACSIPLPVVVLVPDRPLRAVAARRVVARFVARWARRVHGSPKLSRASLTHVDPRRLGSERLRRVRGRNRRLRWSIPTSHHPRNTLSTD